MKDILTRVEANEAMTEETFRMRFAVDWDSFAPGQFVMVEVPGNAVFLRRPFGIVSLKDGLAEVCCKIVGRGTAALSRLPVGAGIKVLGPCGRGFRVPTSMKTAVLIAGGYGIGPIFGLAERLRSEGQRVRVYYGAREKSHLLYLKELEVIGAELVLSTEDGSAGHKGFITAPLADELSSLEAPAIFACGPHGLLEAVAKIGLSRGVPTELSMEAMMACGIGVCQGCVCRDKDGNYVRTCREGPVFDAKELTWE